MEYKEIPEELLDLLMATFLYINTMSDGQNPFVKVMSEQGKEEAFELLVNMANNASYLFPEVEKLNKNRIDKINLEEEMFIREQGLEDLKEG